MSSPRHDYKSDNAEMRAAWRAACSLAREPVTPQGLALAAMITPAQAFRVWLIRHGGTLEAIRLWIDEQVVSVGELQRAILWHPYDETKQLEELAESSPTAKALLLRRARSQ